MASTRDRYPRGMPPAGEHPPPSPPDEGAREYGSVEMLDWGRAQRLDTNESLVPVVLQERSSGEVLFVAWVNREALQLSFAERRVVLWSTSRNEIWRKGATSGDSLRLAEVRVNCEQNSLLFLVERDGTGACHTVDANNQTRPNCYYRILSADGDLAFG